MQGFQSFVYIHWRLACEAMRVSVWFVCLCLSMVHCKQFHLREATDASVLPENTPAARFFKYSFTRLDEGDVRSLALVMKGAFANLCAELSSCERAEAELEDLYRRRFNELEINMGKMSKLGFLLQRLIAAALPS